MIFDRFKIKILAYVYLASFPSKLESRLFLTPSALSRDKRSNRG